MRFILIPLLLLMATTAAWADYRLSGTVTDEKDKPMKGVSVYLENTIDGGTTDSLGKFSFTTAETGNQTIIATEISHENAGLPITIAGDMSGIVLKMKKGTVHDLDMVVITAGSFDASNDKNKTVLKPLDIVTTAGANADVVKALQTLPGTQQTGPDNGLFVRGGDASEAAILVDMIVVQNAFVSGPPGVATRSRFGAFNYQGVSFSSGGYSARYGQALSSVLELNSTDVAEKSTINLGINMAGIYASGTKKWKNASLDIGGGYNNLTPFYGLAATNFKFYKIPVGGSGNVRYVWKPNKNGILKVGLNTSYSTSGISIPNPFAIDTNTANSANPFLSMGDTINFVTKDNYYFGTISYRQMFKAKYSLYTAAAYSLDQTNNTFGSIPSSQRDHRAQFRIEGKDFITARLNVLVGTDVQSYGIARENNFIYPGLPASPKFVETIVSGYSELEWTPVNRISFRPGVRYEHSTLLNANKIAPRLSMGYKSGIYSQVSVAGGIFYQDPAFLYLLAGRRPQMEQATHYIANWQYVRNDRTLRIEGYYKQYNNLVLEQGSAFNPNPYRFLDPATFIDNSGYGYARGLELFWRDKKTVSNLDYWISYSLIDTRRKYANYIAEATPTFIANNNLNVVSKYFVTKLNTSISATYSFATGRPYYNPTYSSNNADQFLSDKTPVFNNLAVSAAYLHTFGKWFTVFYISVDNVLNTHNVFGYRYTYNNSGNLIKNPIVPALYRTVFFGVNMSLTQFSKDEL